MNKESKIYVAGHRGLVGSAILANLRKKGYTNFVLRSHAELDLTDQQAVHDFFAEEKPEYVFLAAAHVGGIMANNTYRADFIYINLMIQNHVIHASYINNVKKLLFLGSTCIYPKEAPQPMPEDCLLTSPLEYTNEPYAIAKIAGIKLCESYNLQYQTNYISVMPTNLYGPNDNFNLETSHVLPAMVRKIHLAKCLSTGDWASLRQDLDKRPVEGVNGQSSEEEISRLLAQYGIFPDRVELWGTGTPFREFLWSEDMADASVYIMESINFSDLSGGKPEVRNTHINIGTGKDLSIKELALLIQRTVGFDGLVLFNADKPDGTMKKLTDVSKLHTLGWHHTVEIEEGIDRIYKWYLNHIYV
ncbi:MAG: GDP-L-fucose synthase [Tannerellaceae bacterium]|nr:GDP-L-fucose synthase [Tannerellaceae bacterium]